MVVAIPSPMEIFSCFLDLARFYQIHNLTIYDLVDNYEIAADPEVIFMDDARGNQPVAMVTDGKQQ